MSGWIVENEKENPLYENFDYVLEIAKALQTVQFEIDEKGVKAAAYVEIPGDGEAMPPEEIVDFVFDPNNFEDDYGNVTFFDDFDGNTLDSTKWDKCPEWERQEHLANHGWWEDDCSWVENGNLVLEGKKDGNKLLSGAIRTKSKDFSKVFFEQAEGLFEFKFK